MRNRTPVEASEPGASRVMPPAPGVASRRVFAVYRADGRHLVTMPHAEWAKRTAAQVGGEWKEIRL